MSFFNQISDLDMSNNQRCSDGLEKWMCPIRFYVPILNLFPIVEVANGQKQPLLLEAITSDHLVGGVRGLAPGCGIDNEV